MHICYQRIPWSILSLKNTTSNIYDNAQGFILNLRVRNQTPNLAVYGEFGSFANKGTE